MVGDDAENKDAERLLAPRPRPIMTAEGGISSMVWPEGNGCEDGQAIGQDSSRCTMKDDGDGLWESLAQPPALALRSAVELTLVLELLFSQVHVTNSICTKAELWDAHLKRDIGKALGALGWPS